jgi:hypothetical protein
VCRWRLGGGGVGSLAYEAKRGRHAEICLVIGHDIATMDLFTANGGTVTSFPALNALAKAVADQL